MRGEPDTGESDETQQPITQAFPTGTPPPFNGGWAPFHDAGTGSDLGGRWQPNLRSTDALGSIERSGVEFGASGEITIDEAIPPVFGEPIVWCISVPEVAADRKISISPDVGR